MWSTPKSSSRATQSSIVSWKCVGWSFAEARGGQGGLYVDFAFFADEEASAARDGEDQVTELGVAGGDVSGDAVAFECLARDRPDRRDHDVVAQGSAYGGRHAELLCDREHVFDLERGGEQRNVRLHADDFEDCGLERRGVVRKRPAVHVNAAHFGSAHAERVEQLRIAGAVLLDPDPLAEDSALAV